MPGMTVNYAVTDDSGKTLMYVFEIGNRFFVITSTKLFTFEDESGRFVLCEVPKRKSNEVDLIPVASGSMDACKAVLRLLSY